MQIGVRALAVFGLLAAAAGLAVLALRPDFDLAVARLFFVAPGHFIGMGALADGLRWLARLLPLTIYGVAVLLYLGGKAGLVALCHAPTERAVIFLTLSLALGPGLLVNQVFKTYVHRPRPVHVADFGGDAAFQPFYRLEGPCPRNCSFPSGESAAAFWTLAPAALAPPPLLPLTLGAAFLFGVATGLLRMAAGAHFLSDVLFAGLLTGLVVAAVWRLVPPRGK